MLKAPELSPPGAGETQNGASGVQPEIAICIITYRRPAMLEGLLAAIERLETGNLFRVSVAVVDNDREQSAREVVARAAARSSLRIRYDVEPEQNLSLARNRSVRNASGEYVAFIDDDEVPPPGWLAALFQTLQRFKVDGVLGPVYPRYEVEPPAWLVRSGVADRPSHETGIELRPDQTRTGNVLLKRAVFDSPGNQFDPAYASHGEDRDFFRRIIGRGYRFVWCAEAAVPEIQTSDRVRRGYYLRRALLRGSMSWKRQPGIGLLARTLLALACYLAALPVLLLLGQGLFMRYLVKTCDHAGRLAGVCGFDMEKRLRRSTPPAT